MARTDVLVLGAGIVGTSAALQLAKRGVSVALVDRRGPGEETSYGNAGVIGGAGVYPMAFPSDWRELVRIALKRSPLANYHLGFLPKILPWLLAFRAASKPERLVETAKIMRPLLALALPEHEALLREAGAERYLRREGWISVYASARAFAALEPELELGAALGVTARKLESEEARALEPSLNPVFRKAIHWRKSPASRIRSPSPGPTRRGSARSAASWSRAMRIRCIVWTASGGWRRPSGRSMRPRP